MPTLEPHQAREAAEGFGADAERYDRTRPRYPRELIELIMRDGAPAVLDVGCGTGILAVQLREAGAAVLGVDVDDRMAALARARGFEVEVAAFEDWDARGRSFYTVVAGQTWHWIDPVAGAGRAAAVLRPGRRLVLAWNVFLPSAAVMRGFAAVYRDVMPQLPFRPWSGDPADAYGAMLNTASEGLRADGRWNEPERHRFERPHVYTRAEWLDQVPTAGGHHRFPPATLDTLLRGLGEVVDTEGGGRLEGSLATVALTSELCA